MLTTIARWSLDRPRLVLAACLALMAAAVLIVMHARFELLPDLAPAQAVIETDAPGLVADQVEATVTRPIESGIAGAPGVAHVHSESLQGLSVVTVTLAEGAEPARVRQALAERVQALDALPQGVAAPRIAPMTAGQAVRQIGFTSARLDAMGLRDIVEWTVRPRLLATPGVSRVTTYGGARRRIEVRARPGDLSDSDLGFLDILAATRRATSVAGAGFIDTPTQRVQIEPHGQALTPEDIGAGQIQTPGNAPVRIEDVADVAEAAEPAFGDALIDGRPAVLVTVGRQYGANTLATARALDQVIGVLRPALAAQGVEVRDDLDRPDVFIGDGLKTLLIDVLVSIALIVVALIVMLRCRQALFVTLVSIPLALLAAAAGLTLFGVTLDAMTIGGLGVALGVVIDDAVLDVDSVLRRLREEGYQHDHGHGGHPAHEAHEHAGHTHDDHAPASHLSRAQAVLAASLEVRAPIVFATLALILALAPLLVLKGPAGALLSPLAAAISLACLASFGVAVVVTPGLSWLFLKHVHAPVESRLMSAARAAHTRLIEGLRRRPVILAVLTGAAAAFTIVVLVLLGPGLLPTFHNGRLSVSIDAPASTSIEAMRALGGEITSDLAGVPGVAVVMQKIGRDPTGYDSAGVNHGQFDVRLKPGFDAAGQDAAAAQVERRLKDYPGLDPVVAVGLDAGRADIQAHGAFTIDVFGPSRELREAGARLAVAALAKAKGVGEVRRVDTGGAPTVRIDLNFQRLALYGLSSADVLETVQAAFQGEPVARIYSGGKAVDVAVSAQASLRRDPEAVGKLLLRSSSGFSVPLSRVAEVYLSDGAARVSHDNGLPREAVVVTATAPGHLREVRQALARLNPPPGDYYEVEDPSSAGDIRTPLAAGYGLALFAVVVLLSIAFDPRTSVIILASSSLALAGGAVGALLLGGVLSIGVIAGLIALFGLSLRHAILFADRLESLVLAQHAPWNWETVELAVRDRLSPILSTSLLIALGLAPFAFHAGAQGREVLGPIAIVILCGLATSLVGSLFVLPVLAHRFWRPGYGRRVRRGA